MEIKRFVDTYEKFYYYCTDKGTDYQNIKEKYGVIINHPVKCHIEREIEDFLNKGEYNVQCFAWKLGVELCDGQNSIKTQHFSFSRSQVDAFCEKIQETYKKHSNTEEMIISISQPDICPKYVGTVQIINGLFFLSKGEIPIYDYYAQVGLKALLLDKNPQRIYVGEAPSKTALSKGSDKNRKHLLANNLLEEYIYQLSMLKKICADDTSEYFDCNGMCISRSLDRALWVYGHASKKWSQETNDVENDE